MANATGQEQEFLELINRFREAPVAELDLLLNSSDSITKANIDGALKQFGTNLVTLRSQWDQLSAVEPLAWASELNQAAAAHNQVMIDADVQAHTVAGEKALKARLADVGYDITQGGAIAENIFTSALTVEYGAASLAIDWGEDDPSTPEKEAIDGIQNPTGHRNNLLSANLREVGISITNVNDPTKKNVGPSSITQNFGNRAALDDMAYILGVAFDDKNNNGFYQDGEGLSDVQVKITGIDNKFSQTLNVGAAGGYQQLLNPGNYQVEFIRDGEVIEKKTTSISAKNVKLDLALNSNLIAQNNVPILEKTVIEDPKISLVEIPTGIVDGVPVTIDMVKRTETPDINPDLEPEIKLVEIPASTGEIPTGVVDGPIRFVISSGTNNHKSSPNDLVLSVLKFGDNLQNSSSGRNLLDFTRDFTLAGTPDLMSQTITVDFVGVGADASYHNYAGLYRVDDADGRIGNLNPGDAGYLTAALLRSKETNRGVELDRDGISTKSLEGGYIYAPFLVANGTVDQYLNSTDPKKTPNVFCNYIAANADGLDHIKYLGANKFAFEDTLGGGDKDYNDLMFQVDAKIAVIGG